MKKPHLNAKLQHDGVSVHGKVGLHGSYAFHKEALLTIVEAVAKAHVMTPSDLLIDLYHMERKDCAVSDNQG